MRTFLWILAIILILAGILTSIFFFESLTINYTIHGENEVLLDKSGQVGDFIGGVVGTLFSLSGFIILILTFAAQQKSAYINQLELKLFELIRLHRENISEITIKRKSKDEKGKLNEFEFNKRQAFKVILDEFITCRNEIQLYFNQYKVEEIYEDAYLEKIMKSLKVNKSHKRLISIAKIDIAYCIVFYGLGNEGYQIVNELFKSRYKVGFYSKLLKYIRMKPVIQSQYWENWEKLKKIQNFEKRMNTLNEILHIRKKNNRTVTNILYYSDDYIKFYGGHQHRLGHYFRHLFQTVNFINSQNRLSFKEKYFYVKTLRAQLSTYEQAIFFINSLSLLGLEWEILPSYKKSKIEFINSKRIKNKSLITKYNLIKNLPGKHIFGIDYDHYYPNVKYEVDKFKPEH